MEVIIFTLLCNAAAQPTSWLTRIVQADMLYSSNDSTVTTNNMPMIGNGFMATQVMSDSIYVSGVFNGYLTDTPSHRARIPSNLASVAVKAPGIPSGAALDIREATYYRRSYLDPTPNCGPMSIVSCTTSSSQVWIEQRWYAHRALASVLVMEVEIIANDSDTRRSDGPIAYLSLVSTDTSPSGDINFTAVAAPGLGSLVQAHTGWTNQSETHTSALTAVGILSTNLTSNSTGTGLWPVVGPGMTYVWLSVIRTSLETADPTHTLVQAMQDDYAVAMAFAENGTLHSSHVDEWEATIWSSGFEIDRIDVARAVNTSLYAILSSVRTDRPFGLSPGGLTAGYNGHTFWDQETWMYPGMLLSHPDVAASLLQYRVNRLASAYDKALSYSPPYSGAMFPWESAFTGNETCPTWAATGQREIHISGDISFAVWQFWRAAQDASPGGGSAWLTSVAWPLLSGIANFWVSKTAHNNAGASIKGWLDYPDAERSAGRFGLEAASVPLHICDVIPPDEYADHVCDDTYTNAVAILALQYAVAAAKMLNEQPAVYAAWADAATRIPILLNETAPGLPPGSGGMHPEYAGYFNVTVKQADTILLGFPLDIANENVTAQSRANDLLWYGKVTDSGGPAMTWGMFALGYVELGLMEQAAVYLNRSFANAQPPFDVWTETPSGGTPNFLTGAGGFLQTAYFGYTGLRINDTSLRMHPLLPPNSTCVKLRSIAYLGQRLEIKYSTAGNITVTVMAEAPVRASSGRTRMYVLPCTECTALPANGLSIAPKDLLAERSQVGRVLINSYIPAARWRVQATALALIDAAGAYYPLLTGVPLSLPIQDITIEQAGRHAS